MKTKTRGQRHVYLLYQRTMDRIWQACLPFGSLLLGLWYFKSLLMPDLTELADMAIFIGGGVVLAIGVLALLSRSMTYVQAFPDHLRLVTPYLRLKISYRRVTGVRPNKFQALFPVQNASWADRTYLEPFYGLTAVVVNLSEYPVKESTMRMFFPRQLCAPQTKGLVLMVRDWMTLSQELDSFVNEWRQSQLRKQTRQPSGYGLLDNLPRD